MTTETTLDTDAYGETADPDDLRERASATDKLIAVLRDRADRERIAADLVERLRNLTVERELLGEAETEARDQLAAAVAAVETASAENRQRAARVFEALAAEVGEDIAARVADPIASAAAERDQAAQVSGLTDRLDSAEVPADLREAAVKALADRDRAEVQRLHGEAEAARVRLASVERQISSLITREALLRECLADPLSAYDGSLSEAWLLRLSRPDVYRDILIRRRAKLDVHPDMANVAILVAAQAWRIDAELCDELTAVDRAIAAEPVLRKQVEQLGVIASVHGMHAPRG